VLGVRPSLHPFEPTGSTRFVNFDTRKDIYRTGEKCHVSHVVCDTGSWEEKLAHSLEEMDEVRYYVKNEHLGFAIPYSFDGEEHNYLPDFTVRIQDGHGALGPLQVSAPTSLPSLKWKSMLIAESSQ
jgi:type III restriction enzyme